jgi:predicted nucleotidyltransferase
VLTDGDIARLARTIVRGYRCLAVAVVGSYAIGAARAYSDLDLLVIAESHHQRLRRERDVRRLLTGVLHPVDVIVLTPAEFEADAATEHAFTWTLARQARMLWWSPQAARAVPSLVPAAAAADLGR